MDWLWGSDGRATRDCPGLDRGECGEGRHDGRAPRGAALKAGSRFSQTTLVVVERVGTPCPEVSAVLFEAMREGLTPSTPALRECLASVRTILRLLEDLVDCPVATPTTTRPRSCASMPRCGPYPAHCARGPKGWPQTSHTRSSRPVPDAGAGLAEWRVVQPGLGGTGWLTWATAAATCRSLLGMPREWHLSRPLILVRSTRRTGAREETPMGHRDGLHDRSRQHRVRVPCRLVITLTKRHPRARRSPQISRRPATLSAVSAWARGQSRHR
jgi:hypothetical protein